MRLHIIDLGLVEYVTLRYVMLFWRVPEDSSVSSGGAKGKPVGAVKPCAPAVPQQLSYSDVDHKRISWLRARLEVVNYDVINITLNSFLVNMADIRLMFSARSSAVAERPHDASCR